MQNKVYFKKSAIKDLKSLDPSKRDELFEEITAELSENSHCGKPLKNSEYFSYRSGNYRAIYLKVSDGVLVVKIAHRKEVYR